MRVSVQKCTDVCMSGNTLDCFVVRCFSYGICEETVSEDVGSCSVQIDCFVDAFHHVPIPTTGKGEMGS